MGNMFYQKYIMIHHFLYINQKFRTKLLGDSEVFKRSCQKNGLWLLFIQAYMYIYFKIMPLLETVIYIPGYLWCSW